MQIYLYSSKNCCTFAAAKVFITTRRLHDVKQQGQAQVCATYLIFAFAIYSASRNVGSFKPSQSKLETLVLCAGETYLLGGHSYSLLKG